LIDQLPADIFLDKCGVIDFEKLHYCLGAVLLSGIVIRVMAPVDHENAPIHATERPAYKRIALGLLIVETICSLLFLILQSHFLLAVSVSTSLFVVSILLIIGEKNRKSEIIQ